MEGLLETMTPLSFRVITGYKRLTGIILISILGKCRESFTRSFGNLSTLVLPVHERACERIDARKGKGARRFDACDRRRDVRNTLMSFRGSRNVRVGMAGGRTWAPSSPSCDFEHEHVRQQLFRLDAEFAGEVSGFIDEKFAAFPSKLGGAVFA